MADLVCINCKKEYPPDTEGFHFVFENDDGVQWLAFGCMHCEDEIAESYEPITVQAV